jgi:hypothetical protein
LLTNMVMGSGLWMLGYYFPARRSVYEKLDSRIDGW